MASLRTARAIFVTEVGESSRLDEEAVKSMTGEDDITARSLHQGPVEFRLQGKLVFPVNTAPRFNQGGTRNMSMPRRLLYILFGSRFVESAEDVDEDVHKYLADKALSAYVKTPEFRLALLGLLLDFYKLYYKDGLKVPVAVKSATNDFLMANDPMRSFFASATRRPREREGNGTPTGALLDAYKRWVTLNAPDHSAGLQQMTLVKFSRGLPEGYSAESLWIHGIKARGVRVVLKTETDIDRRPPVATTVTSLAAQNGACAMWKVEKRVCVTPRGRDIGWVESTESSILAGEVAEAQVKHYLCSGVINDWRRVMSECMYVSRGTLREMNMFFIEREASVRDAVQQIKDVTNVTSWIAPNENFTIETSEHGPIAGRVDFFGTRDRTLYILETKFST
ncbi:hypothetical protein HDU93_000463, partial [Gonapodya sp. JEL0774]